MLFVIYVRLGVFGTFCLHIRSFLGGYIVSSIQMRPTCIFYFFFNLFFLQILANT